MTSISNSLPQDDLDRLVTISVDDGHPSDLRAAELLAELGYASTFYVPARNAERSVIAASGVRQLNETAELGAHTFNHMPLPTLSDDVARREILDGKAWLEDVIAAPVTSFCYPRGKFNRRIRNLVAESGFLGARTTMNSHVAGPRDPFLSGVTNQAFSHRRVIQLRHAVIERNWLGVANYARIFRLEVEWTDHFERAVSYVSERGGVAHLWFHSWELDETGEWSRLATLLRRLKATYQFECVTNTEVFSRYANTAVG